MKISWKTLDRLDPLPVPKAFNEEAPEVAHYTQLLPAILHAENGEACEEERRLSSAVTHYQEAVSLYEQIAPGARTVAKLYGRIATVLNKMGRSREALAHKQQEISIMTSLAHTHYRDGDAYYRNCQYSEALTQFRFALNIHIDFALPKRERAPLHRRMAQVYLALKNLQAAIFHLDAELKIAKATDPNSKDVADIHGQFAMTHLNDADCDPKVVIEHLEAQLSIQKTLPPGSEDIANTHRLLAESYLILMGSFIGQQQRRDAFARASYHKKMATCSQVSNRPLPMGTTPPPQQTDSTSESLGACQAAPLLDQMS